MSTTTAGAPGATTVPETTRFGTFSYLEPLDPEAVRVQVQWMIDHGWNCAIEHVEPIRSTTTYWFLWKLPFFGERRVEVIMDELAACGAANPGHLRRVIGYDNGRQTQGLALVVQP